MSSVRFPGVSRLSLLVVFVLVAFAVAPASGSSFVSLIEVSRTLLDGGEYCVTVEITVRKPPQDSSPDRVVTTRIVVQEEDICFHDEIFSGDLELQTPLGGGLTRTRLNYTYPCSWGNDIGVEVESVEGLIGNSTSASLPLIPDEECGPGIPVGALELTSQILSNPSLRVFFTQKRTNPMIPVTRSRRGSDGSQILGLTTKLLPDPRAIGFREYLVELLSENGMSLARIPVPAAGTMMDPNTVPDEDARFGEPVRFMAISCEMVDLDAVRRVAINLGPSLGPGLGVYFGEVGLPPEEAVCRIGNVNTGVSGPPHDALLVNGTQGDPFRKVGLMAGDPLSVEILDYPGAGGQSIPYAVYVLPRENTSADISPQPFGLGNACFSMPLTGGSPIVLLNTLGFNHLLGAPRFPGTPPGPGTVFAAPNTPMSLSGRCLTFQGVVPDLQGPNGMASLTNAVVAEFE